MDDPTYIWEGRVYQVGPVIEALGDSINYTLMYVDRTPRLVFRSPIGLLNRGRHLVAFANRDVNNINYEPDTLRVVEQQGIYIRTSTAEPVRADVDGYHQNESVWFAALYRDMDLNLSLDGNWDNWDDGAQTDIAENINNLPGFDRNAEVNLMPPPRRLFSRPPIFPTEVKLLGAHLSRPAPPVQITNITSAICAPAVMPEQQVTGVNGENVEVWIGCRRFFVNKPRPAFGDLGLGPRRTFGLDPSAQALQTSTLSGPPRFASFERSTKSETSLQSEVESVYESTTAPSFVSATATLNDSISAAPLNTWPLHAPAAFSIESPSPPFATAEPDHLATQYSANPWAQASDAESFAYVPGTNISGFGWAREPFDLTPYTHTLIHRFPIRTCADLDKLVASWAVTLNRFRSTECDLRAQLSRLTLHANSRNLLTEGMMDEINEREGCLRYIRNFLSRRDEQTVGFQVEVERIKLMVDGSYDHQARESGFQSCLEWVSQRLGSNELMYKELEKVHVTKTALEEYLAGLTL